MIKKGLKREIVFLIVVIIFFIINRFFSLKYVFGFPEIRLLGPDSFYHLKRIIFNFENYPHMLIFDPYLSFPEGDFVPWPPLFDFLGGTVAKIFGDPVHPSVFLNFFISLITLIIILFYQVRKSIISAIVSVSILAGSLLLINIESCGAIDHHPLEVLLVVSFYIVYSLELNNVLKSVSLTIIVTCSFFNWPGAPLYYAPVFVYNLLEIIKGRSKASDLFYIFISFLFSAIFIKIYFSVSDHNIFEYSFRYFSNFHFDFCLLIAFIFLIFFACKKRYLSKSLAFILILVVSGFFHKIFIEIIGGLGYLSKSGGSKLMELVDESQPLLLGKKSFFYFDFLISLLNLTPFYILTPVYIFKKFKYRDFSVLFIAFLYFFLLTVFQIRMAIFLVPLLAIYSGEFAFEIWEKFSNFKKYFFPGLAFIYMIAMSVVIYSMDYERYSFGNHSIYETMRFIRNYTKEKDRFEKGLIPYGILCDWGIGHYVITLGDRPATAHNFITNAKNNKETLYMKVIFSKEEDEVVSYMDKHNTPYLILSDLQFGILRYWDILNNGDNPYVFRGKDVYIFNDNVNELFIYNLVYNAYPTKNLRIVFEADTRGDPKNYMAVIEKVAGARIISQRKGLIVVKLRTKNGEIEITYEPVLKDGKYIFQIPYSSEKKFDVIVDKIIFIGENIQKEIIIKEYDVITGNTKSISL